MLSQSLVRYCNKRMEACDFCVAQEYNERVTCQDGEMLVADLLLYVYLLQFVKKGMKRSDLCALH